MRPMKIDINVTEIVLQQTFINVKHSELGIHTVIITKRTIIIPSKLQFGVLAHAAVTIELIIVTIKPSKGK